MKKVKALIVVACMGLLVVAGCGTPEQVSTSQPTAIAEGELDPAVWGKSYPNQYASYLKNNEGGTTEYGGSDKVSKYIKEPLLPELFKGFGFAKEYNEDRGKTYALQDVKQTKRIGPKTTASCLTCKSAEAPGLIQKMGMQYYTTPFGEIANGVKHSIACADCHDSKTMELKITRPAFIDAMARRDIDVTKASRQEMRSYVCAQCHVEYYFEKETKEIIFPWDKGLSPNDIEKYYEEEGFSDWEHPDSKAKMIKAQHPEFEFWSSSTHGTAGVSCSDCHMPYEKVGKDKVSSHQWTSPLKTIEQSCGTCHRNGTDWLKERVNNTQKKTFNLLSQAQTASYNAHQAVKKAVYTPGIDQKMVKDAQSLLVKGQWRWDFVAAENSTGFHNPALALESLGTSIDFSRQAELLANKAVTEAKK
ncbi:MAG: ammonia-forming cytochrome c nitrite reductase subunit c552 [Thermincolia bacterium]